jgi:hypothetical protein
VNPDNINKYVGLLIKGQRASEVLGKTSREAAAQDSEYFVEFQLIQVMMMKMKMIQFDSIVNLIQMKWVKVSNKMKRMMIQELQYDSELKYLTIWKNYE